MSNVIICNSHAWVTGLCRFGASSAILIFLPNTTGQWLHQSRAQTLECLRPADTAAKRNARLNFRAKMARLSAHCKPLLFEKIRLPVRLFAKHIGRNCRQMFCQWCFAPSAFVLAPKVKIVNESWWLSRRKGGGGGRGGGEGGFLPYISYIIFRVLCLNRVYNFTFSCLIQGLPCKSLLFSHFDHMIFADFVRLRWNAWKCKLMYRF